MNRTAKCIRMLMILRSHGTLSAARLGELLETNPHNIREYKKELEEAGYQIETVRGAYGGYRLKSGTLFALPALKKAQIDALRQVRDYFEANSSFPFSLEAVRTLDEILSQSSLPAAGEPVYFVQPNGQVISPLGREHLQKLQKAIELRNTLELSYQSRTSEEPVCRLVDPYDLICMEGRWYLCGYDHRHHGFRNYRISPQRLIEVRSTFDYFERNPDYRLQDHIGQTTVVKSDRELYKIEVRKEQARFVEEISWGEDFHSVSSSHTDWSAYVFYSDNPVYVLRQLYQFGADIRLVRPKARVERYVKGLKEILANYE